MRFNVPSSELLSKLQAVNKVINTKNAMQILDNFLMRVEGDKLYITGTDQENEMTAELTITESESDGKIALPARRLIETIKELPQTGIRFHINDETKEVVIDFLNGQLKFMGVDAETFPVRNETQEEEGRMTFTIPSDILQKGIENTIFAAATDTLRPIMTGVFWDIHMEDITFVSSDTHKLVKYVNTGVKPGIEAGFILPPKPGNILMGISDTKEPVDVEVSVDSKGAEFRYPDMRLSCRFINGKYPNYNRVIPESNPYVVTIDRENLTKAVKRVGLFASLSSKLIKMNIGAEEIYLSSRDLDYATSGEERVPCSYIGEPMVIGFDSQYLYEVISNMKGEEMLINLSEPSRPGLFEPADLGENEKLVTLLMPMQVLEA